MAAMAVVVAAPLWSQTESAPLKKQAIDLIIAERPSDALVLLEVAKARSPKDPEVLVYFGEAYFQLESNEKAVEAFRAAIAIDQGIASHVPNLGHALLRLRRPAEARAQFETIAASAPNAAARSRALVGVGLALQDEGDEKAARAKFEEALKADPASLRAHYRLALVLIRSSEPAAAIEHLLTVVMVDPLYEGAAYNLALAYRSAKNEAAARDWEQRFKAVRKAKKDLENLKLALRSTPDNAALVLGIARVYAAAGSYGDAASWYGRYTEMKPDDAEARKEFDALRARLRR
jgi:tetratricopeptide (TPR) repeat protein